MKQWMIFFSGFLTGVVVMVILALFLSKTRDTRNDDSNIINSESETRDNNPEGVKMFDEPGDIINERSFKVFQVIAENGALVNGKGDGHSLYIGPVYLLINNDGKYYYDEEKINIPKGKVVRQVGIYQYETKNEFIKTVPIIEILKN